MATNSSIELAKGQVLNGCDASAGGTRTWLVGPVAIASGVALRVWPRYSIVAPPGKKRFSSTVCTAGSGPHWAGSSVKSLLEYQRMSRTTSAMRRPVRVTVALEWRSSA